MNRLTNNLEDTPENLASELFAKSGSAKVIAMPISSSSSSWFNNISPHAKSQLDDATSSDQRLMDMINHKLAQLLEAAQYTLTIVDEDDWSLDGQQLLFMLQYHNLIEEAFATDDMTHLDKVVESSEFKFAFQDMSFDEAYDRYQTMLEEGRA